MKHTFSFLMITLSSLQLTASQSPHDSKKDLFNITAEEEQYLTSRRVPRRRTPTTFKSPPSVELQAPVDDDELFSPASSHATNSSGNVSPMSSSIPGQQVTEHEYKLITTMPNQAAILTTLLRHQFFNDFATETTQVAAIIADRKLTLEQVADIMCDTLTTAAHDRGDSLYPTYLAAAQELAMQNPVQQEKQKQD